MEIIEKCSTEKKKLLCHISLLTVRTAKRQKLVFFRHRKLLMFWQNENMLFQQANLTKLWFLFQRKGLLILFKAKAKREACFVFRLKKKGFFLRKIFKKSAYMLLGLFFELRFLQCLVLLLDFCLGQFFDGFWQNGHYVI